MAIRNPICTVVGHIDHGKSSLLDYVRGSAIVKSEAGAITQAIGASIVPLAALKEICGSLLDSIPNLRVPGLLFIDTPGHAAFNNLRKRGGNLADIAIIVVDINEGVMDQTAECITILREYKTPFVVAANKIDSISGWKAQKGQLLASIASQQERTVQLLEKKVYDIVGRLSEFGFHADRFDRVSDFTKTIAIVPTSSATGEGIPELLMLITGLAQRFLEKCLQCDAGGQAKGTILEVKESKGLGTIADIILYDGTLRAGDTIVVGTLGEPLVTKVKALLVPQPLKETRDAKSQFAGIASVTAATVIRIAAPGMEGAVAGMPILSAGNDLTAAVALVKEEVSEVIMETDAEGIIIKADSLGSLEAMMTLLRQQGIGIVNASIGNITRKDIAEAAAIGEVNPLNAVILGFNVTDASGVADSKVKVLTNQVIYKLVEDVEGWKKELLKKEQEKELLGLPRPCKLIILKGYVFRQSNPAVFGVEVLSGTLKTGTRMLKTDGAELSVIRGIQDNKEQAQSAEKGKQVAVSMDNVAIGRQLNEGDVLYSSFIESEFKKVKDLKKLLTPDEVQVMKEIAQIKRRENPVWGV
ncbi:TPA: translation initiation factor IF-2 [Candidatus Woesearchaeota archaeon]|nr:translation initiation factor IF-2 [Candidatus Woesearchaeota archaeon]HII69219.1 translation initiation factor IF-2 [Candidatus Woesearchaeota archaeon]